VLTSSVVGVPVSVQGRLSDKSKSLNKDEMLEIIQFGASGVFRASEGPGLEIDVDAILEHGEKRTQEVMQQLDSLGSKGEEVRARECFLLGSSRVSRHRARRAC
jgi:hypothetical protein